MRLSPIARLICTGQISRLLFSAIAIKTLIAPNANILSASVQEEWRYHNLAFKPLELILQVIIELAQGGHIGLSDSEYLRIVVPLTSQPSQTATHISKAIVLHREGKLNIRNWFQLETNNEIRWAKEHLRFLRMHGFIFQNNTRYSISEQMIPVIEHLLKLQTANPASIINDPDLCVLINDARFVQIEEQNIQQRTTQPGVRRLQGTIISRPYQREFRKQVLAASGNTCLLSECRVLDVLQTAHIRPATQHGANDRTNGICLRVDLHILFDLGLIQIDESGCIQVADSLQDPSYRYLHGQIVNLPDCVDRNHLRWRRNNVWF